MPKYWLDHIHLISNDPSKAVDFYAKMFGARWISNNKLADGRINVHLDLDGARILVAQPRDKQMAPGAAQTGLEHFGLRTDNLEAAVAELKAGGVTFVQDITIVRPGVKTAFLLTPENTLIELLEKSD